MRIARGRQAMAKKSSITSATPGTPQRNLAVEDAVVSHNLMEMDGSMMRLKTESIETMRAA